MSSFEGDGFDEDQIKAIKKEMKRQQKAIDAAGGKAFMNPMGFMRAIDDPDSILGPDKNNPSGWGGWGGSWSKGSSMKEGGVVRGCGCAQRGRTKGKMR